MGPGYDRAVIEDPDIGVRIGELSRRVGVSADVLRAWERRYGVLSPQRSRAGQRLYSEADEQRVLSMQESIRAGYTPQVAARLALRNGDSNTELPSSPPLDVLAASLSEALDGYRDGAAHDALEALRAAYGIEIVLTRVVLPLLRRIGERWARGELSVSQEHFASGLLIGWLRSITRGWDSGEGPCVLAACPAGEAHDLGLLCFSVLLRERGHRIAYLGASVPSDALFMTAQQLNPDLVLIAGVREEPFWNSFEALTELSDLYTLMLGGAGASTALGAQLRAEVLSQDLAAAADAIAAALSVGVGSA